MPFIILSQPETLPPEFAVFPRRFHLERMGAFATYPRFVEFAEPILLSFPRLMELKPAGRVQAFPRQALLVPEGSPLTGLPLTPITGGTPVVPVVSCVLGNALKFEYEHTGDSESATITVKKARHEFPDALALNVAVRGLSQFTTNLTVDPRQWEETTEGGVTITTVRLYNPAVYLASTKPLPELVPWKIAPRQQDEAKGPPPRQIDVSQLVRMAAAAAGVTFSVLGGDPFVGETWMEGRRDTGTEGKTFTSVASEVYGATHRLIVRGRALLAVPHGVNIQEASITESFSPCAVGRMTRRGEAGNVPGLLRLSASDALMPKPPILREKPEDATPEKDSKMSWLNTSRSGEVTTITAGYVYGGLLRQTQEMVRGNVTVKEKIDDEEITREFKDVLIGVTRTDFNYHPDNPEALVLQTTLKQNYGYTLNTEVSPKGVSGVMFGGFISAGDLVSEETETVAQEWYERGELAGYQRRRIASGRRLVSVEQENAEAKPQERGPLVGKEFTAQVQTDEYRRIGKLWNHAWGTSGGSTVPLFDMESGEAVRLAQKTGTMQSGSEIMQNDPPKVNWPQPSADGSTGSEDVLDEVSVAQRMAFRVEGGGLTIMQQDFPMLRDTAKLPALAALMAAANGPRIITQLELRSAFAVLPGAAGVTALHISMDGQTFTSSVTREMVDVPTVMPTAWPDPEQQGVGVVQSVTGQEVTLRTLNGTTWDTTRARLPAGVTVAPGTAVAYRLNGQGVNVIVNGVR